ncbi:phosphoadenylyl-sulfate reductase [Candidatus Uhrbacteria bacterium]|nr:phosphoadenylyl-sulfate reductase [Candidatus Uhrbacteria bacterium]
MNLTLKEKADLSQTIIKLAVKAYPRIFAACSFGKDSRVIVDLATKAKPDLCFLGIDTGYEFEETLSYGNSLVEELKLNFEWLHPGSEDIKRIDEQYGDSFIKNDQYKCCEMKIPAIESALPRFDAWITGLRRDETEYRKNTPIVEAGKIAKINPIAFWTKDDVWQYIKENNLRYHPLYDHGYLSLGCKPCTTGGKVREGGGRQGQFERAGRFTGTQNLGGECGLHTRL